VRVAASRLGDDAALLAGEWLLNEQAPQPARGSCRAASRKGGIPP
jgi:hypothetical protein